MQDVHDDYPYDAPPERVSGWSRAKTVISTVVGALVAMSLLMALGIWFYRLGVRDAENVPIIRAALEPEKERPTDPGGAVTPHQGITSYEVAEATPAQAASIVLAPDPAEPAPEDVAQGQLVPEAPRPPTPEPPQVTQPEPPVPSAAPQPETPGIAPETATPETGTPTPTELAANTEPTTPDPAPTEPTPEIKGGSEWAPADAPEARARPANLQELARQAAERDVQAVDNLAARAASSPVQIQLAANPDEIVIRQMWERIRQANPDLLGARALAVQTTVSGGVTFYRLRVGPFENRAEARAICQALKARNQDCIVAQNS
ncbi:MAG: SPOR domain-containing protein [Pseudomonadota bacterium]